MLGVSLEFGCWCLEFLQGSLLFVHLLGREQLRFGRLESLAFAFDGSEETRLVTLVTRRAGLLDLDQQRIAVAIERDVLHLLRVAAGLALHPELLARAAPEMRLARCDGGFERSAVHPGHHQHATGFLFLDDGRDQPVPVKFQFIVKTHVF